VSIIPTGDWTMEKERASGVSIANADDKKQLIAVLAVTAAGEYLGPQLLYKRKTTKCHPQISFSDGWNIWHSDNHWSNKKTIEGCIEIIVIPFIAHKSLILKLEPKHPAMALFDGFKGQMTDNIHSLLVADNIVANPVATKLHRQTSTIRLVCKQASERWYESPISAVVC